MSVLENPDCNREFFESFVKFCAIFFPGDMHDSDKVYSFQNILNDRLKTTHLSYQRLKKESLLIFFFF